MKFLAVLIAFAGFYNASAECESLYKACAEGKSFIFPETENELISYCKNGKELLSCSIDYKRRCSEDHETLQKLLNAEPVVNELCDEDNFLFKIVAAHIDCIKRSENHTMYSCPETVISVYSEVLDEKGFDYVYDDSGCSSHVRYSSCWITHTRHNCGGLPADALLEIFMKFELPYQCPPEISAELPTIQRRIELQEGNEAEETRFLKEK